MNKGKPLASTDVFVARQASKASVAFGAVLTVLGIFAVMAPLFSGIAVTVMVGILLMMGGIVEILFAFKAGSFGKGIVIFLFGGLGVAAGVIILVTPLRSLSFLTIILAAFFVVGGIMDVVLALKVRPVEGWGWMLFSGIVSVILGGLIIAQWPLSGTWAVGVLVGIRVLIHGWMLMALGRTGQEVLTHVQDTRVEALERHIRPMAKALQEIQVILVEHSAVLLTLGAELREKVGDSEVDPLIRDLNVMLGEARESMQHIKDVKSEVWDAAQNEANTAFEKLHRIASEITDRLKQELNANNSDSA
jgi:uncharacterized membrane protein HdeD (DUF308 family)